VKDSLNVCLNTTISPVAG